MNTPRSPRIDLKALPNLPGFRFPLFKERHLRPQTWGVVNGQRIEQREGLSHDRPKFVKSARPADPWKQGSLPETQTRRCFKASLGEHQELPAWDALDRHVLRFHGYFKETVSETNLEHYRIRKVVVLYYLEDDTCHVIEPRQDNSGIPQGTMIRRHRFPSPDGSYLKAEDLRIGEQLNIYGKCIMITDADVFTRQYCLHHGYEQGPAIPVEVDQFVQTRAAMTVKSAVQPRTYEKLYREVMLGGGHINADMQQFLGNDRRVLRFFCVLEDVSTPQFERRPFTILFFLADNTTEIREHYPLNAGRDNFPIFLRRQKLPRGSLRVDGPQSQPRKSSEFVMGHEFRVGETIVLAGNQFYIYDCDGFSRDYFRQLGMEQGPARDVHLPDRAVPRAPTPPYTGYGSWDDSMGSVTHLIPKPPRKDFRKLFKNEGRVLRFTARFVDPKPEDVDRHFVVNFYLQDDTMSIHEPPQRNLGIVTGKFLERGVHLNQVTGNLFKPEDLSPGKIIRVLNHEFETLDTDEYTRKELQGLGHREYDIMAIMEKLRESMRQQFPLVRDIFRRFDQDHDGIITFTEFRQALEKFGFMLDDKDTLAIMQHFDRNGDGQVSYNEFCDTLLDADYSNDMMVVQPGMDTEVRPGYADLAMAKSAERTESEAVRRAVRSIGECLYKCPHLTKKLLKEFEHVTHDGRVTIAQLHVGFQQLGHMFDIQDLTRCVLFVMPDADLGRINLVYLFKAIHASFHDLSKVR
jgi:hypothetical protein